jgi:hypothetical protein
MSVFSRKRLWDFFSCIYKNQLTGESEKVSQPEWIKTPLFAHQKSAVRAALAVEESKKGIEVDSLPGEDHGGTFFSQYGILGDRVGSGKSLIALSLIKYPAPLAEYNEYVHRPNDSTSCIGLLRKKNQSFSSSGQSLRSINTALFVIPHALMGQWEDYVREDTSLKGCFIKRRKDATDDGFMEKVDSYDAVFVSSTMWRDFAGHHPIDTLLWSRLFIDEADTISVSINSEEVYARFYWLVSASWINLLFPGGTYLNIESNLPPPLHTETDLIQKIRKHTRGDYLNVDGIRNAFIRHLCGSVGISSYNISLLNSVVFQATRLLVHNTEGHIRESFNIPEITHKRILCLTPPDIRVLHNMISDSMMERLNAGDPSGVLEMLGMTTKSPTEIIHAVTESNRNELKQLELVYNFKKQIDYSSENARLKALEQLEEKMARVKSRIEAIESRISNTGDQTCPICFCEVSAPALTPCCRNLFCFACICAALKRSCVCPLCRETIHGIQSMQVLKDGPETEEAIPTEKLKTKQEAFREFLKSNPDARVLMFSGYDATFEGLSSVLETDGIPHATLNGSQARITKLIDQFGKGKYRVLFLNARNMGAGLNIRPATHVVLYHRMAIETQNQIIGRAMRMGRTEPLTVLHLLYGSEMESQVLESTEGAEDRSTEDRIEHA